MDNETFSSHKSSIIRSLLKNGVLKKKSAAYAAASSATSLHELFTAAIPGSIADIYTESIGEHSAYASILREIFLLSGVSPEIETEERISNAGERHIKIKVRHNGVVQIAKINQCSDWLSLDEVSSLLSRFATRHLNGFFHWWSVAEAVLHVGFFPKYLTKKLNPPKFRPEDLCTAIHERNENKFWGIWGRMAQERWDRLLYTAGADGVRPYDVLLDLFRAGELQALKIFGIRDYSLYSVMNQKRFECTLDYYRPVETHSPEFIKTVKMVGWGEAEIAKFDSCSKTFYELHLQRGLRLIDFHNCPDCHAELPWEKTDGAIGLELIDTAVHAPDCGWCRRAKL